MSKDKHLTIISKEAIEFIILQIFSQHRNFENWGMLGHVTRLNQSRASENILRIINSKLSQSTLLLIVVNCSLSTLQSLSCSDGLSVSFWTWLLLRFHTSNNRIDNNEVDL